MLRREQPPLVAVVRLRKRDEWVLPKGKLDDGETARVAAKREVLEETGHNVTVHEFLGTLVYESGGRPKVVHYWRMEAIGGPVRELMHDIRAVDWLPLDAALARLSRGYERAFLENVGPLALATFSRKLKAKPAAASKSVAANKATAASKEPTNKAPAAKKRRGAPVIAPPEQLPPPNELPIIEQAPVAPPVLSELSEPASQPAAPVEAGNAARESEPAVAETPVLPAEPGDVTPVENAEAAQPAEGVQVQPEAVQAPSEAAQEATAEEGGRGAARSEESQRRSLAQKVRNWLGRAA